MRSRGELSRKSRGNQRGAVLVEAIVVVAFFIVAFTGLNYFHNLYLSKIRVSRIARVATLHHAIVGCDGNVNTELAQAGGASVTPGGKLSNDVPYKNGAGAGLSPVAASAAGHQSGVGSSLDAKIVHITNDGVAAERGGGMIYGSKTDTTSYVGCSDPVSNEQYGDIIPNLKNAFSF